MQWTEKNIVYVTAYPYASVTGTLEIPETVQSDDIDEYINEHFDEIKFDEPELDYRNPDFDWEYTNE